MDAIIFARRTGLPPRSATARSARSRCSMRISPSIERHNPGAQRHRHPRCGRPRAAARVRRTRRRRAASPRGPLHGVPVVLKDGHETKGMRTVVGMEAMPRPRAGGGRRRGGQAQGGRRDHPRQDQRAAAASRHPDRQPGLRPHQQPMGARPHAGRLERRGGRGARRRPCAARHRQRPRRLDPLPRPSLRRLRLQADRARRLARRPSRRSAGNGRAISASCSATDRWRATSTTSNWRCASSPGPTGATTRCRRCRCPSRAPVRLEALRIAYRAVLPRRAGGRRDFGGGRAVRGVALEGARRGSSRRCRQIDFPAGRQLFSDLVDGLSWSIYPPKQGRAPLTLGAYLAGARPAGRADRRLGALLRRLGRAALPAGDVHRLHPPQIRRAGRGRRRASEKYWRLLDYTCPFNLTGHPAGVMPARLRPRAPADRHADGRDGAGTTSGCSPS